MRRCNRRKPDSCQYEYGLARPPHWGDSLQTPKLYWHSYEHVAPTRRTPDSVKSSAMAVMALAEVMRLHRVGLDAGEVDLDSTYTVARGLSMLGAISDTDTLRRHLASLRNADGGYSREPGHVSSVYATYRVAAIQEWIPAADQ